MPDASLSTKIPNLELEILEFDCFDIETDCYVCLIGKRREENQATWNGLNDVTQVQLV